MSRPSPKTHPVEGGGLLEALQTAASAVHTFTEQRLTANDQAPGAPPITRLIEAMRYTALSGGKAVRAFLALETAHLYGVSQAQAIPVAAAIEALHAYSLIHDDLPAMDDSPMRRGQPSNHLAYDEATAILAGDALQALAFEWITEGGSLPLVQAFAKAVGKDGMVGGQMLDIQYAGEAGQNTARSITDIETMEGLKTGALIQISCEVGPLLADAPSYDRQALRAYGAALGLLFQVTDDVLDATGEAHLLGKATGQDQGKGFVTLLGLTGAQQQADLYQARALGALAALSIPTERLQALVHYIRHRKK